MMFELVQHLYSSYFSDSGHCYDIGAGWRFTQGFLSQHCDNNSSRPMHALPGPTSVPYNKVEGFVCGVYGSLHIHDFLRSLRSGVGEISPCEGRLRGNDESISEDRLLE